MDVEIELAKMRVEQNTEVWKYLMSVDEIVFWPNDIRLII